jgi:hypothetical protein
MPSVRLPRYGAGTGNGLGKSRRSSDRDHATRQLGYAVLDMASIGIAVTQLLRRWGELRNIVAGSRWLFSVAHSLRWLSVDAIVHLSSSTRLRYTKAPATGTGAVYACLAETSQGLQVQENVAM